MTIILIPKSDDNIDRQMPIFHEHTSDFDDWWCKSGFADVDKLLFFRRPKKRVRFDEGKMKFGRSIDMMIKKMTSWSSPSLRKNASVLMNQRMKFGRSIDMMIKKMSVVGWILALRMMEISNLLKWRLCTQTMMKNLLRLIQILPPKMRKLILLAHIFPVMKIQGEKIWLGGSRS